MAIRFLFSKLQKSHPQDFKLLVNRSTVASVIKSRRSAYAICMLNILQGAGENAEVLQMIYLKFICNTSAFFLLLVKYLTCKWHMPDLLYLLYTDATVDLLTNNLKS
jgi:hypothetical protein